MPGKKPVFFAGVLLGFVISGTFMVVWQTFTHPVHVQLNKHTGDMRRHKVVVTMPSREWVDDAAQPPRSDAKRNVEPVAAPVAPPASQTGTFYPPKGFLPPPPPPGEGCTEPGKARDVDCGIHTVFSTGCTTFQHWQSELVLFSHWKSGQKGPITRLVSGCHKSDKGEIGGGNTVGGRLDDTVPLETLQKSSHPNFALHVTPNFEQV